LIAAPTIDADGLNFGIKGLFLPENGVETVHTFNSPALPFKDASNPSQF